jgi:hypothetical protein
MSDHDLNERADELAREGMDPFLPPHRPGLTALSLPGSTGQSSNRRRSQLTGAAVYWIPAFAGMTNT